VTESPADEEPEVLEAEDRSHEDDEWAGGSYGLSRETPGKTPRFERPSKNDFDEMGPKIPEAGPEEPPPPVRHNPDEDEEWSRGRYDLNREEPWPTREYRPLAAEDGDLGPQMPRDVPDREGSEQIQTSAPRITKPSKMLKSKRMRRLQPPPQGPRWPLL